MWNRNRRDISEGQKRIVRETREMVRKTRRVAEKVAEKVA